MVAMKKLKHPSKISRLVLSFVTLFLFSHLMAQNKTPDYWKCENKVPGQWNFGIAPAGCDVSPFGEVQYVLKTYGPVVFSEEDNSEQERSRYMEEMALVLREAANDYIHKRNPEVSEEEALGFMRAILTMSHQESYWTHYRNIPELPLKMMRGDHGHGHGLMQVDDRWHFVDVNGGAGWNLMKNILYSMEQYYAGWMKSLDAPCISSPLDYRQRAQAAYSAYNGGMSKICRWTNPNDKWARNDKGFLEKYEKQLWFTHIQSDRSTSEINVDCLMEGHENCPLRTLSSIEDRPDENSIYDFGSESFCIFRNEEFYCVSDIRDEACLGTWARASSEKIHSVSRESFSSFPKRFLDRHDLCIQRIGQSVFPVGSVVQTKKDIYLRGSPAGSPLGVVPSGTVLQIYDFEYRDSKLGKRYYQVSWKDSVGFIYGGEKANQELWIRATTLKPLASQFIARPGERVEVIRRGGINLRSTLGGAKLLVIPQGTQLAVQSIHVVSDSNEVYYKTKLRETEGYFYAGQDLPEKTFLQWSKLVPSQREK